MSALRLASREADQIADEAWVDVVAPVQPSYPRAAGVVLSLAAARHRYERGISDAIEIDLAEIEPPDAIQDEIAENATHHLHQ